MMVIGIFIGAAYGFISSRGQFCMNSGFSDVGRKKDTVKLKAFITAILVQASFLPVFISVVRYFGGDFAYSIGFPHLYNTATIAGGFLFGVGMHYAGGCGAGIFFKAGERNTGAMIAVLGFVLGVALAYREPLYSIMTSARGKILYEQTPLWGLEKAIVSSLIVSLTSGAALYYMLKKNKEQKPTGAGWGWKKTGLGVGVTGIVAWLYAMSVDQPFGMSVIPGALDITYQMFSWAVMFLLGIPIGAYVATEKKQVKMAFPKTEIIIKRLMGGIVLGVAGAFGAGCTMGHGLTFTPLLGVGSIIGILSIFAGSYTVGYLTRKK